MTFKPGGFNKINEIGASGTGKGSVRNKFGYVDINDAVTVETAGFFDPIADQLTKGDQIDASLDVDVTPILKNYIVTSNVSPVTIAKLTTV